MTDAAPFTKKVLLALSLLLILSVLGIAVFYLRDRCENLYGLIKYPYFVELATAIMECRVHSRDCCRCYAVL